MKKLVLMFALAAFVGANTVSKAASLSSIVKIECEKCGKENCKGDCTKDDDKSAKKRCCKKNAKASCSSKGTEGTASAEVDAPKCATKKSCCKSKKAKTENDAAAPAETTPPADK